MYSCWSFFCQAEDGIRDLVRSRGLGDVYKRQKERFAEQLAKRPIGITVQVDEGTEVFDAKNSSLPVSYTHLTLPTSDLV